MENDPVGVWLLSLIQGIVLAPEDIKIVRKVDELGVLYTLTCNPIDNGRIIGKQGETVTSIRKLLHIKGMKEHARVSLKVDIPNNKTFVSTM